MAHPNHAIVEEEVRLRQKQADLERRVNSIQGRPASSAELTLMRDYQEIADPLYRDLGMSGAPGPLGNESVDGYRRRIAAGLQPYAAASVRDVKISAIPRDSLPFFEKQIYADAAVRAADRNWTNKPGTLREIRKRGPGGREIVDFAGDPKVTWAPFMPRRVKYVTSWGHDPATGRPLQSSRGR